MSRTDRIDTPDATPRAPALVAAFVLFIATMLLAWPALGGAFLVNPNSDQYIAGYAFREFAARSLREGNGFPLWNPFQFGGMPYVAAMHGDIFYPTFLLRMILPTDIAMTWGFIIHTMLAGFFTFGFLRASGVRFHAAVVGGIAYLLSGSIASYASPGHDGKLFVSALLPAALWLLVRGIRDGWGGAWGLLALIVGLGFLSPHPQLLQYMLLVAGAYALFLSLRPRLVPSGATIATLRSAVPAPSESGPSAELPQRARLVRLAIALGAVILGSAIGAVQYLPVREYVPWSPRSGGKGYDYATSFSFPLEETINVYLPQFSGILQQYWGRNGIHFHSEYMGVVVLVLALLAFGGGVVNRHRAHAWFWLGALVVSLFWAWGGATPFYQLVYALVPGTKYFRAPSTILYVCTFSVAVLAAFGAERALAGKTSMRYAIGWAAFSLVIALIATTGGFTNLAMSLMGDARGDAILSNANNVVVGAWRSAAFVIAALALLIAVARGMVAPAIASWALAALVAVDLWSIERHYWMFSPRASALYAEDPIIKYLNSQPQPGRVIALPLSDNMTSHDPFVMGDALMHHRVRGVLGYHGNELGRFQQLYGKEEGMQSVANPNFWALTNSRFFYTNAPEVPFPGATLVAGPVRNAAGTMTYLFQLPGENPAAWVAPLVVKLDDPTTKATILNPNFDVRRVAIVDSASAIAARPVDSPIPPAVSFDVRVDRYEPGAIDLTLQGSPPAGSALVVSENFYPGWTAEVDGKPATTSRADFTLIGVELPAGARQVRLRFDSPPVRTGGLITLAAIAGAIAWAAVGAFAGRRRTPTSQSA
jgi:hypothetical protein